MNHHITEVANRFADSLALTCAGAGLSHEGVRHLFLEAMSPQISASDIRYEYPHPSLPGAKVDVYIPLDPGKAWAFEFKFHQKIQSGKNQPRTQHAGQLFRDIFRLARFQPDHQAVERYLVYVTDGEMAAYLRKPSNGLNHLFSLRPGEALEITKAEVAQRAETFRRSCQETACDCRVTGRFGLCIKGRLWVRVYEVE
jgi:hypothetical protein